MRTRTAWLLLAMLLLTVAVIRIRLAPAPLERDEGEYAYAGQLILEGIAPYDQVYNMKQPGIYATYALILALFGKTPQAIHLGLLVANSLTGLLLFLLARRLFTPLAAIAAAAAWLVLSLSPNVQGVFANAEQFVLPFALGGLLILMRAFDRNSNGMLLFAALLLGAAFMVKQHGAAYLLFAGAYLICREAGQRPLMGKRLALRIGLFALGALLPWALACAIFAGLGLFDTYWFWTFSYARQYISAYPMTLGVSQLFIPQITRMMQSEIVVWLLAVAGPLGLLWSRTIRRRWLFAAGFLLCGLVAICPGFFFRPHYFVLLLPAVALWAGIGVEAVGGRFRNSRSARTGIGVPLALIAGMVIQALYEERDFYFNLTPQQATRSIYRSNPFPESIPIAGYIRRHSDGDQRIAVLGSEPQIFFYAKRRSSTGYIYMYDLVKKHDYAAVMRREMIREIEEHPPEFIVFVHIDISWLANPTPDLETWYDGYIRDFERVGIVDIFSDGTISRWDDDALAYEPRSIRWVEILRRKNDS